MGGLSKKAYQLNQLRQAGDTPVLAIDAGALFFKNVRLAPSRENQEKLTAQGILKAYNVMDFSGLGITSRDLVAGLDFLQELETGAKFPFLSANLVKSSDNASIFKASHIVTKGNIRIGLTALTNEHLYVPLSEDQEAKFLSWEEALEPVLTQLASKSDLVILFSNLPQFTNREIAKKFDNLHMIFEAGTSPANTPPQLINNTLICQSSQQGKYIGIIDIDWRSSGLWGNTRSKQIKELQQQLSSTQWQIDRYKRKGDPEVFYKDNQKQLQKYHRLLAKADQLEKQITASFDAATEGIPEEELSTFENRFVAMKTTLPADEAVQDIVDKVTQAVNEIGRQTAASHPRDPDSPYLGWQACSECHPYQSKTWQESRHAKAFDTLIKKEQQYNLDCVYCHVTGVDAENAINALSLPQELLGVGCESCHGPGKKHVEAKGGADTILQPRPDLCLSCHQDEHDGEFIFQQDVDKLNCREP